MELTALMHGLYGKPQKKKRKSTPKIVIGETYLVDSHPARIVSKNRENGFDLQVVFLKDPKARVWNCKAACVNRATKGAQI